MNKCHICNSSAQIYWLEKSQDFCIYCWIEIVNKIGNKCPTAGLIEYAILGVMKEKNKGVDK